MYDLKLQSINYMPFQIFFFFSLHKISVNLVTGIDNALTAWELDT